MPQVATRNGDNDNTPPSRRSITLGFGRVPCGHHRIFTRAPLTLPPNRIGLGDESSGRAASP